MHLFESPPSSSGTGRLKEVTPDMLKNQELNFQMNGAVGTTKQSNSSRNKTRWDEDAEDSGVDSVSSVKDGECTVNNNCLASASITADVCEGVQYASVVTKVVKPVHHKSFLHTVYENSLNRPHTNAGSGGRKALPTAASRSADSMRFHAVRNKLEQLISKYSVESVQKEHKQVGSKDTATASESVAESSSCKQDSLESLASSHDSSCEEKPGEELSETEVKNFLDSIEIQPTGPDSLLLITRDGMRASLRLSLSSASNSATQKNAFSRAAHRSSKRASQKRHAKSVVPSCNNAERAANEVVNKADESLNKTTADAKFEALRKNVHGVRRRPSQTRDRNKMAFSVNMPMTRTKVALLASKFNSIINESKTPPPPTASTPTRTTSAPFEKHRIDPIPEAPSGTVEHESTSNVQIEPCLEDRSTTITDEVMSKRAVVEKSSLEQPGMVIEPATVECVQPEQKSCSSSRNSNHNDAAKLDNSQGVYGTVKSYVKHAIRKFEKTDATATGHSSSSNNLKSRAWSARQESHVVNEYPANLPSTNHIYSEPKLPEGIAPNTSFLWRNRQSTQNLIYEAAAVFPENNNVPRVCSTGSNSYYDLEAQPGYGEAPHSNTYDTLNLMKPTAAYESQMSLSGYDPIGPPQLPGYDEIQPPDKTETAASTGSANYDDIKSSSVVAYDELNYNKRRSSASYDELQTTSDGYIDPSSSSALGYERLLNTSSDYGSTTRYEVCKTPSFATGLAVSGVVTALPAVVDENQVDSILYDDIHGYGGSHHSYEPIYAHLNGSQKIMERTESATESQHQAQVYEPHDVLDDHMSETSESGTHEVFSYRLTQLGKEVNSSQTVPDSPAPSMATSRAGTEQPSEGSDEWVDISDPEESTVTVLRTRRDSVRISVRARGQNRRRLSASKNNRPWSTMRAFVKNKFSKATWSSPHEAVNTKLKISKTLAARVPSCGTEGSSQTCEDYGESDRDDCSELSRDDNIYEVIGPQVQGVMESTDYSDSSFDSDEPSDENSPRGQDTVSERSKDRPGSQTESERSKDGEDPSMKLRFVQVAGRIRENWSSTKSGISKSIKRIKKRSTVTVTDLSELLRKNWRDASPEKAATAKSQPDTAVSKTESKKESWSFGKMRKAASASAMRTTSRSSSKESSKFYVTVTIEKGQTSKTPEEGASGSTSPVPPLVNCKESPEEVPLRPRRSSSVNRTPTTPVRPKTAPPEPPKSRSSAEISAAVQSLAHSRSDSQLPSARESPGQRQTLYSDLIITPTGRRDDAVHVATPNTPYSRLSWASSTSRTSNENYIGLDDVASSPANPGQLFPVAEDGRSYLDLQSPSEAEELYISSHFADEPLYQFYTASIIQRAEYNQGEGSEEDDYEVIGEDRNSTEMPAELKEKTKLPTAMELVTPSGGRRTLWCELPEVINSGILESISPQQRKLQEAMFEVITSEASYLRSLNVLTVHFIASPEFSQDQSILNRMDRETLFGDIVPVRECSERMLADLEKRWQESAYIREICDIIVDHASKHFSVYIKYCSNQLHQERKLRQLKEKNPQFVEVLRRLESDPVCQSLAMHSFLMLPMQRITRLPLLVDAIFHRLDHGTPEYERCQLALAKLNRIVQECNEGARKAERLQEMLIVSNQLDFADVKAISIMSASRWLVKKGEMQRLFIRDFDAKLTFGRKFHKQTVYLFLFNDLLVVTKKKSDDCYSVLDYCPRNMVAVDEYRTEKTASKTGNESMRNLILLTMLENHERKEVDMILACSSESDRTRWLEAVTPRISENPEEKIYEEWDCPQVQAVHSYMATQPDELSLDKSEVVNVLRKMADGWYQGERLRDGERGWFPGNYTVEIASAHVRARNLRQRYRLLALSGNFLEEQARREKDEHRKRSKKLSLD